MTTEESVLGHVASAVVVWEEHLNVLPATDGRPVVDYPLMHYLMVGSQFRLDAPSALRDLRVGIWTKLLQRTLCGLVASSHSHLEKAPHHMMPQLTQEDW